MSSLLRTTKLVRYFAGAARTLILNSAKTAEANLLVNSKVSTVVSNVLLRDYSTTKKTESLEPLLQRLDSEVRRFGRISKKDIDDVFDQIRARHNITSSQSLLVIRCCGELVPEELPEQRTKLVQKIWSVLAEIGIPMDISHYNALLRVYIENEHQFSPAEFLEELEKKGLQPNRVTYQRLMWRYCQDGDVEGATKVLEKMRELGFPVSEPVLNALVMGHAFLGDTDGAKAVLETMAGAGLQPSNRTYALLACGYAKKGDLENVLATMKTANEKDAIMSNKDILEIIESFALAGHGDKAESLFDHLNKGIGYNQDVCNLILRLINKGQEDVAKKIMKTMPRSEKAEQDTMYKGAFFIKQLIKLNKPPEDIIKTCRELMQENLVPSALYIATEGALQHGLTDLALQLFKELQKEGLEIRQHYYWPLLVKKGKENDEEGLLHILRNMASEGVTPTGEALREYVIPYLKGHDKPQNVITKLQIANIPVIHGARNLMVELLDSGKTREAAEVAVQYRPYGQLNLVTRPLLNALGKTKDVKSFVTILHVITSRGNVTDETSSTEDVQSDDTADVGRLVLAAVKNLIKPDLCDQLFSELHSKGLRISTTTAENIEQYLGENLTHSISEKLVKLTSPDLESVPIQSPKRGPIKNTSELEQLVARNQSRGTLNPRLQKQLLTAYIQENNIEKVENYLNELKKENIELTNAMLAQLIEFYASNGMIDKAYECKEVLNKNYPDFELNKFKIIELAHALVKADRYDDALKELKNYQHKDSEEGSFLANSKSWQLLNTLADKKDPAKVVEMTDALIENGLVEASNVLLGPSIKAYLAAGDVAGALKQFEACCARHRATPWKGELMKALIMKEDAARLQWLADISTQIHGETNILHDLVLAFVECGRLRQARRILETPGLHAKNKRLHDACERYVQEGKSEHLEGLLEATKELSHIDRSNIFYHLMVTYCKADETDKAVGLWTLLQEEGEVPSSEFLTYLANHLRSKGREIPFVVPQTVNPPKPTSSGVERNSQGNTNTVTKQEISDKIENLVKEGKAEQAMDMAIKSLKDGVTPRWTVLKFLVRSLAEAGNADKIRKLEPYLGDTGRRNVTYDDKLTLAIFNQGRGDQHVSELHRAVSVAAAAGPAELQAALAKYPRSNALASIVHNEELFSKCREVAELGASHGIMLPMNLLWLECIIAGKDSMADELWNKYLVNSENIVYRRLLQETHMNNKPELAEKLISYLKTNKNMTERVLANVYSRLINLHIAYNNTEAAKSTLEKALSEGINKESIATAALKRLENVLEIKRA